VVDRRLLDHYNRELAHLRELGAEFAAEFPKIAARLGLNGSEVVLDPYVERLLEGAAFLAARVQLKLDAEFPRFTQHLLEMLHPHYLAPTPSMLIAQFQPILGDANLAAGSLLPRGTAIRHLPTRSDGVACEFRTGRDLTLWPLELTEARYFSAAPELPLERLGLAGRCRGGVKLKLRATAGLQLAALALDQLRLFLAGASDVAHRLHELIGTSVQGLLVRVGHAGDKAWTLLPAGSVTLAGFEADEALLPPCTRSFDGHRLLQEYFALPARFLFFELAGLAPALAASRGSEVELVLLFDRGDPGLEAQVRAGNFLLNCVPAINLFERRLDRIQLNQCEPEFHVVADRTRPSDYEIYDLLEVTGLGAGQGDRQFRAFYSSDRDSGRQPDGYYTLRREPRLQSGSQRHGQRSTGYVGSEAFLALVDPQEAPYPEALRQLSLRARCTNRDLPLLMVLGSGHSDFALEVAAPVESIRCIRGPSPPQASLAQDASCWKFISQLSLNHLSLIDSSAEQGAVALRELLSLHAHQADAGLLRQVEGLRSVRSLPVVSRLPLPGPLCFGRGVEVTLELDELAFEGGSAFLLGCVLERFLARHVSLNGFTETVLRTLTRGEIMRWRPRCGTRPIL
jgi:type VI secretion system protein ImpG